MAGQDAEAGGPTILNLSSNVATLTPEEQLIVTAVVTDPQGIAQVVGGTLSDPSGASYGAFQVSTTAGAFSLTLTWMAIETVQAINLPAGGGPRPFVATFYDQAGHSTTKSFDVKLQCDTAGDAICAGSCYDFQTDASHCGSCTNDCGTIVPNCYSPTCDVACTAGGLCSVGLAVSTPQPCSAVCAGAGLSCACSSADACLATYRYNEQVALSCATTPPAYGPMSGEPFVSEGCGCVQ